jgi:two-component system LytT family response regulator
MKVLIIDDDYPVIKGLTQMIQSIDPTYEVIGSAMNIDQASQLIANTSFNVLFLDIEIGKKEAGFDLLDQISNFDFHLVFITAFNQYAVKAFRYSAIDFLLKPINPEHLNECLSRIKRTQINSKISIEHLKEHFKRSVISKTIVLKTQEAIHIVKISHIIRCEAQGNYTLFYFTDGKKLLISQTLKRYDKILSNHNFFRIHQSHLINLEFVTRYDKADGGSLILGDDHTLPVSPQRKYELFDLLELN